MNAYNELLKGIKYVLDNCTAYRVSKDLNINARTINRYQNGTSPIENMSLETAGKIYDYYIKNKEKIKMKIIERNVREWLVKTVADIDNLAEKLRRKEAVLAKSELLYEDDFFAIWLKEDGSFLAEYWGLNRETVLTDNSSSYSEFWKMFWQKLANESEDHSNKNRHNYYQEQLSVGPPNPIDI